MILSYGLPHSLSKDLNQRFQDDFRLVISNAKTFNPPGTIYYSEAERIEAWVSDHLTKAASCVIEYETDWNIDVDRDEDVNVDAVEDAAGGRGSAGPDAPAEKGGSPYATNGSLDYAESEFGSSHYPTY